MKTAIALPIDQIKNFCQHWQIIELSLFGSVLRADFRADSDIDFLVAFAPTANWGLLDHAQIQQELEILLSRPVDLISKRAIERSPNWIRRQAILSTAQPIYRNMGNGDYLKLKDELFAKEVGDKFIRRC